jgi:hypothetical protein
MAASGSEPYYGGKEAYTRARWHYERGSHWLNREEETNLYEWEHLAASAAIAGAHFTAGLLALALAGIETNGG